MPALLLAPLPQFIKLDPQKVIGTLTEGLAKEGFDTNKATSGSWKAEIADLQEAFIQALASTSKALNWTVCLEYVLPIVGNRVDCVLLADDLIFVVEYKGGESSTGPAALSQAQNYALDLSDFHEESRGRVAIPIAVGTFQRYSTLDLESAIQGATVSAKDLPRTIVDAHRNWSSGTNPISPNEWNKSRYFPVPSIVEAASAIYQNHNVKDLAFSRSGRSNLEATQIAIANAVADAKTRDVKKLIIITGVPGAGKTLAGLNIVQNLQQSLDLNVEQASFMSGNGPLVSVLCAAIKRSVGKKESVRSIRSRIRDVHRFVRDSYGDSRAPSDRLIVFDEAQRAWTASKNKKKFGRDISEPEMVMEIMARHSGWAVIVALVGGGQEIHSGEGGLSAWGEALIKNKVWEVSASPEAVNGGPSIAGSRLFRGAGADSIVLSEHLDLHLAISKRSYETEVTAAWVNAVLAGHQAEASKLAANGLPIFITRDLCEARSWLKKNAKGRRRSGLIASSGASRLRAEGVETPTFTFLGGIDYPKWFLEPTGDHRSSNQLEVALSEFELQGLELDLTALLWGGDLIFSQGKPVARFLSGKRWSIDVGGDDAQNSADDRAARIRNKYRVLLTRFRKGMVIFVPKGCADDPTRAPADFDAIFEYLVQCGVSVCRPHDQSKLENPETQEIKSLNRSFIGLGDISCLSPLWLK